MDAGQLCRIRRFTEPISSHRRVEMDKVFDWSVPLAAASPGILQGFLEYLLQLSGMLIRVQMHSTAQIFPRA